MLAENPTASSIQKKICYKLVEKEQSDFADMENSYSYEDFERMCIKCLKYCVQMNQVSNLLLLIRFPISHSTSCKIIDWMESKGYISNATGDEPREVLLTMNKFSDLYGHLDFD